MTDKEKKEIRDILVKSLETYGDIERTKQVLYNWDAGYYQGYSRDMLKDEVIRAGGDSRFFEKLMDEDKNLIFSYSIDNDGKEFVEIDGQYWLTREQGKEWMKQHPEVDHIGGVDPHGNVEDHIFWDELTENQEKNHDTND